MGGGKGQGIPNIDDPGPEIAWEIAIKCALDTQVLPEACGNLGTGPRACTGTARCPSGIITPSWGGPPGHHLRPHAHRAGHA
jgi:hypothetical protein